MKKTKILTCILAYLMMFNITVPTVANVSAKESRNTQKIGKKPTNETEISEEENNLELSKEEETTTTKEDSNKLPEESEKAKLIENKANTKETKAKETPSVKAGIGASIKTTFPDTNMALAVADKLGKSVNDEITQSDIDNAIDWFDGFAARNIESIEGIQYFTNLDTFSAPLNNISDITMLSELKELVILNLAMNKLSDLEGIQGLEKLNYINLNLNSIQDLKQLQNLTQVDTLTINDNQIKDIDALKFMTRLKILDISNNQVHDLRPLNGLVELHTLSLGMQKVVLEEKEVTPMFSLKNIVYDVQGKLVEPTNIIPDTAEYNEPNIVFSNLKADDTELSVDFEKSVSIGSLSANFQVKLTQPVSVKNGVGEKISDIFPDTNFAKAVADKLEKSVNDELTQSDIDNTTDWNYGVSNKGIKNLEGIQYFVNLISLNLHSNEISNVEPLAGLTSIKYIELSYNSVTDISPLADLNTLTNLYLNNQTISLTEVESKGDLSIQNNIKYLDGKLVVPKIITDNGNYDNPPMVSWHGLTNDINQVSYTFNEEVKVGSATATFSGSVIQLVNVDTHPIAGLRIVDICPDGNMAQAVADKLPNAKGDVYYKLKTEDLETTESWEIGFENKGIENIEGLQWFSNISVINFMENNIKDISSLENYNAPNLIRVTFDGNDIENIDVLNSWNVPKLKEIYFIGNKLQNINGLTNFNVPNLIILDLQRNNINDLSGFAGFNAPKLKLLRLSRNKLTNLDGLASFNAPSLLDLTINDNYTLSNIDALADFNAPALEYLGMWGNQITNLDAFADFNAPNLYDLGVDNNEITNIDGLANFEAPNLTDLSLYNNEISDMSPLENLSSLTSVKAHDNVIENFPAKLYNRLASYGTSNFDASKQLVSKVMITTQLTSEGVIFDGLPVYKQAKTYSDSPILKYTLESASDPNLKVEFDNSIIGEDGKVTLPLEYFEAVGIYFLRVDITDGHMRDSIYLQTINVQGSKPSITLNNGNTGTSTVKMYLNDEYSEPGFYADNGIGGNITGNVAVSGDSAIDSTTPGTYKISYYVENEYGFSDQKERNVIVLDEASPQIALNGESEMSIEVREVFDDPGATAYDPIDGPINNIEVEGNINPMVPGDYYLTYIATAPTSGKTATATRKVTVIRRVAPTITLNGEKRIIIEKDSEWNDPGATADDGSGNDITESIFSSGKVHTNKKGIYFLMYTVSNDFNETAHETRVVEVVNSTKPAIALNGLDTMNVEYLSEFDDPGATATDEIEGDLTKKIMVTGNIDTTQVLLPQTLTYTVTNSQGNSASVSRFVWVTKDLDIETFSIELKGENPIIIEQDSEYEDVGYLVKNKYGEEVSNADVTTYNNVDTSKVGFYKVTYTITGTQTSVTRKVNVINKNTEIGDNYALYAQNFSIDKSEVASIDILNKSKAKAWHLNNESAPATPKVVNNSIEAVGGVYPVVIGMEESNLEKTIYVSVTDENTIINPEKKELMQAYNFEVALKDVDNSNFVELARVKAWNTLTGAEVTNITLLGVKPTEIGVHKITFTTKLGTTIDVYATVKDENTIIEGNEMITAQNFGLSLEDVAEADFVKEANAKAWNTETSETLNVSLASGKPTAIGVYEVTFKTVKGTSISVYVSVTDETTEVGDKELISAKGFMIDISDVEQANFVDLADAKAWNTSNGSIVQVSMDGNKPTELGASNVTFTTAKGTAKTVQVIIYDDIIPGEASEHISANHFAVNKKTLDIWIQLGISEESIKESAKVKATRVEGNTIANIDSSIKNNEIESTVGVYPVTFESQNKEAEITIYVTVFDDNSVIGKELMQAENFTVKLKDIDNANFVELASVKAHNTSTGAEITNITLLGNKPTEVGVHKVTFTTMLGTTIDVYATVTDDSTIVEEDEMIIAQNFELQLEKVADADFVKEANAKAWNTETSATLDVSLTSGKPGAIGVHEATFETAKGTSITVFVTITDSSTVVKDDEMISANNFEVSLEEVTNANFVALADAKAWNTETSATLDVSLTSAKPEAIGVYEATFETAKGTSITVYVSVTDVSTELKDKELITARGFTIDINDISQANFVSLADARAWSTTNGSIVQVTMVGAKPTELGTKNITFTTAKGTTKTVQVIVYDDVIPGEETENIIAEPFRIHKNDIVDLNETAIKEKANVQATRVKGNIISNISSSIKNSEIEATAGVYSVTFESEGKQAEITIQVTVYDDDSGLSNKELIIADGFMIHVDKVAQEDFIELANVQAWNTQNGTEIKNIALLGGKPNELGEHYITYTTQLGTSVSVQVIIYDDTLPGEKADYILAENFTIQRKLVTNTSNDLLKTYAKATASRVEGINVTPNIEINVKEHNIIAEIGVYELTLKTEYSEKIIKVFVVDDETTVINNYVIYGSHFDLEYTKKHNLNADNTKEYGKVQAFELISGAEVSNQVHVNEEDLQNIRTTEKIDSHPISLVLNTDSQIKIITTKKIYANIIDDRPDTVTPTVPSTTNPEEPDPEEPTSPTTPEKDKPTNDKDINKYNNRSDLPKTGTETGFYLIQVSTLLLLSIFTMVILRKRNKYRL